MNWGNKKGEKRRERPKGGRRRKIRETRRYWHSYLQNCSLGNDHIWMGPYEVIVADGLMTVKMLCKMKKLYR